MFCSSGWPPRCTSILLSIANLSICRWDSSCWVCAATDTKRRCWQRSINTGRATDRQRSDTLRRLTRNFCRLDVSSRHRPHLRVPSYPHKLSCGHWDWPPLAAGTMQCPPGAGGQRLARAAGPRSRPQRADNLSPLP